MIFDKSQIKNNFSRSSENYDQNAILQKIVAQNLVKLAESEISKASKIIDLGSGTGFVTGKIIKNFPKKEITQVDISTEMLEKNPFDTTKIVADIENLPFEENSFDLAISSLSFQWLNNLEEAIPQILKTIKKDGELYFSILGSESLKELKIAKKSCEIEFSINEFKSEENLRDVLKDFNFTMQKEEIILDYQNCFELLKSMKKIGANYSSSNNLEKNNLNKSKLELINNFYLKNFNLDNKVFASWQIFYIKVQIPCLTS
ncbi:MAG: malonyl-CoA O-methyltransferase [Rickettsiales bacterium]|jgi:malonyl-CoA O-methyltransferase